MSSYDSKRDSYKIDKGVFKSFISIGLIVTTRCNLRCLHCCETCPSPDVPSKDLKGIISKLAHDGLIRICITGGEPSLRKDLVEILKYIRRKKIFVTLSTNGLILNKNMLSEIKPFIDNIRFSLHGLGKTHDKITGLRGSYQKVIDDIKIAKTLGVPVSIISTVMNQNFSEMVKLARKCEELGVEKLCFFTLMPKDRGRTIYKREHVGYKKAASRLQEISSIAQKEGWNLATRMANWELEGQCVLAYPNGDLVANVSLKDKNNYKIIGNLFKASIKELWDKYPFKKNYINYHKNH